MNTDEKVLSPEAKPIRRRKPTPIVTANGNETSRASQESTTSRRKRVRITTSETPLTRLPESATPRFDYSSSRGEYSREQATLRSRIRSNALEVSQLNSVNYEEKYQANRAQGNFDYNYNRSERPQQKAQTKYKANSSSAKKKNIKKKQPRKDVASTINIEPIKYQPDIDPTKEIRLNKFLANAGICSRREADQLIENGEISVNGVVVKELGKRVTTEDIVMYQDKRVQTESKVYVLLNKPKGCVTTTDDPECRFTVMDIVRNACTERIYPVGRLDRNTTGVILITNDGDLSSKLTHPSFLKKKIYHVWLDKPVEVEDMQRIAEGIELEDGEIHADAVSYVKDDDLSQVGIEIHSGRNRIVRRIFEHLGYRVIKLDRVYFAGLTKKNLPRGKWRYLNEDEVNALRMGAFE